MIFNLSNLFNYTYLLLAALIIYYSSVVAHDAGAHLPDLRISVDLNSLGSMSLYWMWTNTYYLYSFFILTILALCLSIFDISESILFYILCLYILMIMMELALNLNLSLLLFPVNDTMIGYNLLLNNSVNNVHPLLVYFSWAALLSLSCSRRTSTNVNSRALSVSVVTLSTIFFTLILGGWWAYQEGSWGGWWNWDPSETFGLLILALTLLLAHLSFNSPINFNLYSVPLALSSVVYYLFLQLNFSLISHNFGIRQGDVSDFSLSYSMVITIVLLYAVSSLLAYFSLAYDERYTLPICNTYSLSIAVLLCLTLYLSTLELWSTLLWNLFSIDLNNISSLLHIPNALILIILTVNYFNLSVTCLLLPNLLLNSSILCVTVLTVLAILHSNSSINKHLNWLVLLMIIFYYANFSLTTNSSTLVDSWDSSNSLQLPSVGCSYWEDSKSDYKPYLTSVALQLNTLEVKLFELSNSSYATAQRYVISWSDVSVLTNIIDTFNAPVFLLAILYFYVSYLFHSALLIINF